MASSAVVEARTRRGRNAARVRAEMKWFIEEVSRRTDLTLRQRVLVAVAFLQDRIVQNISKPVVKKVVKNKQGASRTIVTKRSKPGEFPRADTTLLMKTIFHDVQDTKPGVVSGFVGTPLDYGVILELKMNRSFLMRTFDAEKANLIKMIGGTPIP